MTNLHEPTFDNFIAGEPTRAALLAAREAARYVGTRHNPLFLFGGTGTGKTHLLRAISGEITARDPSAQVYLESYTAFGARLRASAEAGDTVALRERFSSYDAFLLDDLDDDDDWPSFQREIIRWIDRYLREERQVVLASSRPLSRLQPLEERFLSRVRHGLVVPVGGIDGGARETVASRILRREGLVPDDEALRILGHLPVTDMREMIGIVNRVAIAMRTEEEELGPGWLTHLLQRLVRDGEVRRFRVTGRELPAFGNGVTRVEVALDGEGHVVEADARGDEPVDGGEAREDSAETGSVDPGGAVPVQEGDGAPTTEARVGAVTSDRPTGESPDESLEPSPDTGVEDPDGLAEAAEEFAFDEAEGYVLDWDREEDRLLNDL